MLNIAAEAKDILFGFLLSQQGLVWMVDVRLEPVSREVPTIDLLDEIAQYFPVNLDFSD